MHNDNLRKIREQAEKTMTLVEMAEEMALVLDILQKELSGVRDGDGWWHGSDPTEYALGEGFDKLIELRDKAKNRNEPALPPWSRDKSETDTLRREVAEFAAKRTNELHGENSQEGYDEQCEVLDNDQCFSRWLPLYKNRNKSEAAA
jgi:hypothetical protein